MPGKPRSHYVELAPPADLAPYVRHLWAQVIGEGEGHYDQPVLPDGCIDLIASQRGLAVAGPSTEAFTVRLAPGAWSVGAQFHPGAAPPLLGPGADDLRDSSVAAADLWGRAGRVLGERALAAGGRADRLAVLVEALRGRAARAPQVDPAVTGSVRALQHRPGTPIPVLADAAGLSERQLRRRVEAAVGYPPRTLARVLRFQRFLDTARAAAPGGHDLARLAAISGYADQAHLTRETRRLAGLPPAALLAWEAERLAS